MIHIIGKGNGEAVVFDDESPPEESGCDHDFGDSNRCQKCGMTFGGAADPRIPRRPPPTPTQVAEAQFWEGIVGEDDLRPAGSNAAPPGSE